MDINDISNINQALAGNLVKANEKQRESASKKASSQVQKPLSSNVESEIEGVEHSSEIKEDDKQEVNLNTKKREPNLDTDEIQEEVLDTKIGKRVDIKT